MTTPGGSQATRTVGTFSEANTSPVYVKFGFTAVATGSTTEFVLAGTVSSGTFFIDDVSMPGPVLSIPIARPAALLGLFFALLCATLGDILPRLCRGGGTRLG